MKFPLNGGPGQRRIQETGIAASFLAEHFACREVNGDSARYFPRKGRAEFGRWTNGYSSQKGLHIASPDALQVVLHGRHFPVQQRHGNDVRQTVVRLLLDQDLGLRTFLSASDDLVRNVKDIDLN